MPEDARLPDGPKTPAAFNGLVFLLGHHRVQQRMKRRYGDAYTVKLPGLGTSVVVARPDLVKQVFTADPTVLHAGKNELGRVLGPGSLFAMDEDRHLEERRMLLPPFHGDRMRSYETIVEEETRRAIASWPEGRPFPTLPTFNAITLRVILRAVFGAEGTQLTELETLLPKIAVIGQRMVTAPVLRHDLGPWSHGGKLKRLRREYGAIVDALIDRDLADAGREDEDERIDILALMLRELRAAGRPIDRSDVADELLALLSAGHETTSSSLAWTVERLRRHPAVLARLEDEVASAGPAALRQATILEVQRVRPVINGASPRKVMKPFDLGPWRLPPGTFVFTLAPVMHHDERFHQDAGRFDPDRYVGKKPDTYAWIPFGGGRRRCLGAAFAQMEMDVVLRTVLREFELLPTEEPAEREAFRGLSFGPGQGGVALVRRRPQPLAPEAGAGAVAAACPVPH
jgi:cytochrome P450